LGKLTQARGAQTGAVQSQNLDLARRLGLSVGYAKDSAQALDAGLQQDSAEAVERRRAQIQQEITARRAQAINELLQRQQSTLESGANTLGAVTSTVGSVSEAVGGALASNPWTAAAAPAAILAGIGTQAAGVAGSLALRGEGTKQFGTGADRKLRNVVKLPSLAGRYGAPSQGLQQAGGISDALRYAYDPERDRDQGGY